MYLAFYALREEPFRLTPDPRFFHLAQPHREVLIELLRAVMCRKGFALATGPIGTGKTTVLHTMLHLLEKLFSGKKLASAFLVNPTLSRAEFLEAILDEFEVTCSATTKPRRLLALYQVLREKQANGGTTVLVIDEAHLLTTELLEEVRLLSNIDSYADKPLQVILCGQPELVAVLEKPNMAALQQRIAVRCKLRPLTLSETHSYVGQRLQGAGLRTPSPFLTSAVDEVHQFAQGIPRVINLLCDRCLLIGSQNQQKVITAELVEAARIGLGLRALNEASAPLAPPALEVSSGVRYLG